MLMLKIGVFPETGTGVILSLCGCLMIWKRLFASVQSQSYNICQDVERLLISTERVLTTSQSHPKQGKEYFEEYQRYSTVGLSQVPCHSLSFTIRLVQTKNNSRKDFLPTSLLKVLTKPEDGSTLSWSSQPWSKIVHHSRI